MKKIDSKILIITAIFCLLPILIGISFYDELPNEIAIHFDINNNADNYVSKNVFVYGFPMILLVLQMFLCIVNDLGDRNKEANKKTAFVYKWIIPILSMLLYIITIMYSLGYAIDIRKVVMIILGIILIVTGNYIPKTKENLSIGFKNYKFNNEKLEIKYKNKLGLGYIIIGFFLISTILSDAIYSVIGVLLIIVFNILLLIKSNIENKKVISK